jgi:hypothetical protein
VRHRVRHSAAEAPRRQGQSGAVTTADKRVLGPRITHEKGTDSRLTPEPQRQRDRRDPGDRRERLRDRGEAQHQAERLRLKYLSLRPAAVVGLSAGGRDCPRAHPRQRARARAGADEGSSSLSTRGQLEGRRAAPLPAASLPHTYAGRHGLSGARGAHPCIRLPESPRSSDAGMPAGAGTGGGGSGRFSRARPHTYMPPSEI